MASDLVPVLLGRAGEFRHGRAAAGRRLALALLEDQLVAVRGDLADAADRAAGAGRDQPADDDVLLEALERVDLALDRRLGEHAGGLLEGGRRDEGAGLQARLGDAEQDRHAVAGFLPSAISLSFIDVELELVDLLAREQVGVARLGDLDLLQHLADDHLDVLVVDRHALQPVDVLDLVDEVGGKRLDALDRQDVVRRRVAVDDVVALLDGVAFLQMERLALRDQVLDRLGALLAPAR